jgi:hypothetical protein
MARFVVLLAQEKTMNNLPITSWLPVQPLLVERTWSMRQRTYSAAMSIATQRIVILAVQGIEPLSVEVKPEKDGGFLATITYHEPA